MANTKSALKALRQSKKRASENLFWKERVRSLVREIKTPTSNPDILNEQFSKLQSYLDKAVKNKVIHKNKAARLKSRVLKAAHAKSTKPKPSKGSKPHKSEPDK
ncbi:30S ribosomal protein S20 [candidate division WWE3 bacterium RIFCSPHIGHO2_01_FULL_40_23]|uniref:Small ribosomal subunit protein bS20 n=1 Tax=candidate division WWE3 bacterium RIFCSPLOWO2_01_FULL_41_18 TaxID=1802625 RepID=A0A1F4VDK4_UNCKA|nr:MAG: 30S ribosomal protein S20 [candidate division WWE3 bacterium RIFCSPHIGHO2_01_FULL_40_23]OGC55237.1 MAG: 30S ribosomal protein S20 [candidate division WWE3 bacterium RIFCSPLOWO2_01_FULL_41_18]